MIKQRFAFGKSRTLTEFQSQVYLRILIKKLSQGLNDASQPLIFLFHNAASERNYFQLMNIDVLDNVPERIPLNLLRPTPSDFRNNKWSGYVVLDTQRLWKSFLIGKEGEKDAPMALGPICKSLGITTKYLHNAGMYESRSEAEYCQCWHRVMVMQCLPSIAKQAMMLSTLLRSS